MAKKKAKHASNQSALDRLLAVLEKTNSTNYVYTLRRAISSLAACPHAIETRKQACELKGVGPQVAKILVPDAALKRSNSTASDVSTTTSSRRRALPKSSSSVSDGSDWKTPAPSAKQVAYDKAFQDACSLQLPSGPWTVVLLLDGREQRAEHVQAKLQMSGVPCEQRNLPIGDMAWLARCGSIEILLGTIVERKEVCDLASSLFGTRYLEQRLRLQHCGLPQLLLLVEGNVATVTNCPGDTLETAMMETRVQLDFQVIRTRHLDDTVRFLKNVHRRILQRSFPDAFSEELPTSLPSFRSPGERRRRKKNKVSLENLTFDSPPVPPLGEARFITYLELKTKVERDREAGTRTVGATHAAMLKQISSFSLKKVQAIQQAYPTPQALLGTYVGLDPEQGKTLVQDFTTNTGMERNCRVGPKSAAEVYFMCTEGAALEAGVTEGGAAAAAAATGDTNGMSQESVTENVARMPTIVDESSPSPDFAAAMSPPFMNEGHVLGSQELDSRKPAARKRSKSPAEQEMDFALQRRREQYQATKQPKGASGLVDLTQDDDDDLHVEVESPVAAPSFSQGSSSVEAPVASAAAVPTSSQGSSSVEAPVARAAAASVPSSSQGSSSMDGDEDEPLYVRCQRLHQAREAVLESRKRQRTESSQESSGPQQQEVIEIE